MKPIIKWEDLSDLNKHSILREIWYAMEGVAEEMFEVRHYPMGSNVTVEGIELNDNEMTVAYDVYDDMGGMCSHEVWEDIPLKYLWEDGHAEKERQEKWEKQMVSLRKESVRKEQEKLESARAEKELFLTLKKKYEPVDLNQ